MTATEKTCDSKLSDFVAGIVVVEVVREVQVDCGLAHICRETRSKLSLLEVVLSAFGVRLAAGEVAPLHGLWARRLAGSWRSKVFAIISDNGEVIEPV